MISKRIDKHYSGQNSIIKQVYPIESENMK
jgi:hypothetical protein